MAPVDAELEQHRRGDLARERPSSSQWTFCAYTSDGAVGARGPGASPRARRTGGHDDDVDARGTSGDLPDLARELARLVRAS